MLKYGGEMNLSFCFYREEIHNKSKFWVPHHLETMIAVAYHPPEPNSGGQYLNDRKWDCV